MRPDWREDEGPDDAWLEAEAERRRGVFLKERRAMNLAQAQGREALPLHRRLHDVMVRVSAFTTSPAGKVASASPSAIADSAGPPSADPFALAGLHRNDVERHVEMIRRHLTALEAVVDTHQYGGGRAHTSTLLSEEKDKLVLTAYEGLSPEAVAELDPDLGDAIVIRRVRKAADRDPETGQRRS